MRPRSRRRKSCRPLGSWQFSQSGRITFNFEFRRKLPVQLRSRVHGLSLFARGGRYFPLYKVDNAFRGRSISCRHRRERAVPVDSYQVDSRASRASNVEETGRSVRLKISPRYRRIDVDEETERRSTNDCFESIGHSETSLCREHKN